MAHAQKPDFVFRRNGRVHLNRRGRQFGRILAAEVCASAVVILDTPCSEVVWEYWLRAPFASFPFTSPPVRHRVSSHFKWTLEALRLALCTFSLFYEAYVLNNEVFGFRLVFICETSFNEMLKEVTSKYSALCICQEALLKCTSFASC